MVRRCLIEIEIVRVRVDEEGHGRPDRSSDSERIWQELE